MTIEVTVDGMLLSEHMQMLNRVVDNFNVRVAAVIQQRGAWIEHIINY